jgi:DNA-directed RNA polymerase specialized sigma subunit
MKNPKVDQLLTEHKRLIESEAARYAKFVPVHVVLAEAYKLAREAAESFDPASGNKFSTHLVNSLKKLSRTSTKYGGILRVPENKQFKIHRLNQAEEELRNELGRSPSLAEVSQATGMSVGEISGLKQARKREVNVSNLAFSPVFIEGNNDDWVHFVYFDLPQRDKVIMEHKIGFGGKPILSNDELAAMLNTSPSTISNRVKIITARIEEGWKG